MKKKISEEQKKKLIWKYFWEQKRQEIFKFFKIFLSFILISALAIFILILINNYIAYPIGNWLNQVSPELYKLEDGSYNTSKTLFCFVGWLFIILLGLIVYCLSKTIWNWIKDNWKQAKERVEKELSKK